MSTVKKISAMIFQNNQILHRRHGFGEIIKIHRRHGFGENTDCGNREVKLQLCGSRLGRLPYEQKCRYRNVRPHSLPAGSHSFVGMARETAAMPPAGVNYSKQIQDNH